MPIRFIEERRVGQTCAACGAEREIALEDIVPRVEQGTDPSLELPSCPRCGAVESLVAQREGDGVHPHALVVEIITIRLGIRAEPPDLEARVATVFPHGIRIERGSEEATAR